MSKVKEAISIGNQIAKDPTAAKLTCDLLAVAGVLVAIGSFSAGALIDYYYKE